jgi:hypothetical protein
MATLVAINPKIVSWDTPPQVVMRYATTSTSWKAGQFLRIDTSGILQAVANGATTGGISYLAISDRASADAAGYIAVIKITNDMVFEMHVTSSTATFAMIGQQKGIDVSSNICTVDPSSSETMLFVEDIGSQYDPARNNVADTLARVRVKVPVTSIEMAPAA